MPDMKYEMCMRPSLSGCQVNFFQRQGVKHLRGASPNGGEQTLIKKVGSTKLRFRKLQPLAGWSVWL